MNEYEKILELLFNSLGHSLDRTGECNTLNALSNGANLDLQQTQQILDDLVRDGHVTCVRDPSRGSIYKITKNGEDHFNDKNSWC